MTPDPREQPEPFASTWQARAREGKQRYDAAEASLASLRQSLAQLSEEWYAEADGLLDDQDGAEPDDTNGRDKARAEVYAANAQRLRALVESKTEDAESRMDEPR